MKVFVLGLDGATFDRINPLVEAGAVPNIARIISDHVSGPLLTTFPPVTAPAWLALATGLNPGKTGVFDYINRKEAGGTAMTAIDSSYYRGRAVWDLLSDYGNKVGIFNYPTLSPPPQVNGFSVSGMGRFRKEDHTFPKELAMELEKATGGYEVSLNLRSGKYRNNMLRFMDDVDRVVEKQWAGLRHLVVTKPWDFFFAVFHFTDWMQHLIWNHLDKEHPQYDRKLSPEVERRFTRTWTRIDAIIGELLALLPGDANFMIVSDHGAGPLDSAFYPNTWLAQNGWLVRSPFSWRDSVARRLAPLSSDVDNKYLRKALHLFKKKILGERGIMEFIDFDASLAYSPEHAGMFGCINLTARGRALEEFRRQLVEELKGMPGRVEGVTSVDVYLPEEIYSGPFADRAPDILFIVNGYRSSVEIDFADRPFMAKPSIDTRTGGHLPYGVFMAKGEAFTRSCLEGVSVLDITPTILALFGIKIPASVDGRVIEECLTAATRESVVVLRKESESVTRTVESQEERLDEMREILKSLGYM